MNSSESPRKRSAAAVDIADIYDTYGAVLTQTLIDIFGVPPVEAGEMVRESIEALITAVSDDPEGWVIAATCRSGEAYQLASMGTALAGGTATQIEAARDVVFLRRAFAALPEPARRAVQRHFREQRTYEQIAEELGVTTSYVKRLILGALSAVRNEQRRRQMLESGK
ncbi:MAG TPA: sigma factor-like helix-turn-helix DNA-binding protein [Thermoanaerobaculia bacterium]